MAFNQHQFQIDNQEPFQVLLTSRTRQSAVA
jgi:hypothetical protein